MQQDPVSLIDVDACTHHFLIWIVTQCTKSPVGSAVLTQTHPAAPYVCRTGSITLRCQYEVTETVLSVQWIIRGMLTDPATIFGHTTTFPTSSYQEVVVDSYVNLMDNYTCSVIVLNGSLSSNDYMPTTESECLLTDPLIVCSKILLLVKLGGIEIFIPVYGMPKVSRYTGI